MQIPGAGGFSLPEVNLGCHQGLCGAANRVTLRLPQGDCGCLGACWWHEDNHYHIQPTLLQCAQSLCDV